MFEVTGDDILALDDSQLRTLIARLSLAELGRKGLPLTSVTAGGNQDAADGGIDVRVEMAEILPDPDFIPRPKTGFQVKKPDMSVSAIRTEMRPNEVLRPVIGDLADAGGSYVIVSARSSVADRPLTNRRDAMRAAVADHPRANDLHVDFYDRERITTWVNGYPGVAAWVRMRAGRDLSGWRPIGNWSNEAATEGKPYLSDATACLIDERSAQCESLHILEGIARIRVVLNKPRQAARIIGLSGLGKTRLVQALFENGVGDAPLDPGLALYTDYSEGMTLTARDMACRLIKSNRRTILVVDNCNPQTHDELARLCTGNNGSVSLITVEYDVGKDEPERTEVFRLQNASSSIVSEWIERDHDHISQVDRHRIADFSDGNFRVARALAQTLGKGETLGLLKDAELFRRIFWQRHQPDQSLLLAAEDLSLFYSFDGVDCGEGGELARIGRLRRIAPDALYATTADLSRRDVIQRRGRWRAILPQAIANSLAANALQRIPALGFDLFCADLSDRMLKSLSRRLGYLHDSSETQHAVKRWLAPNGLFDDLLARGDVGLEIVRNIAPVAPGLILAKLVAELGGPRGPSVVAAGYQTRRRWIELLKLLAYEPEMFEEAAMALARFVATKPEHYNDNSANKAFGELFQLYFSGTLAGPRQRRDLVGRLAHDLDPELRRCAPFALDELLRSADFWSTNSHAFGARPRGFGWEPATQRDISDWFKQAIVLTLELDRVVDSRAVLAHNVRDLWRYADCHAELDRASEVLSHDRAWFDGWLAFRLVLRRDGAAMVSEAHHRLSMIIDRLKPVDLLGQAQALVLTVGIGGFNIVDAEDGDMMKAWAKTNDHAAKLGEAFANDEMLLRTFLPDLFGERSATARAWPFGKGLATGADDPAFVWTTLRQELTNMPEDSRNITVLGGFLSAMAERNPGFASSILDVVSMDPVLANQLPWLQSQVGLDEAGIQRLIAAIDAGRIGVHHLFRLASGIFHDVPAQSLIALLTSIAALPDGSMLALDVLRLYFYRLENDNKAILPVLIDYGRTLLEEIDFLQIGRVGDYGLKAIVIACLSDPSSKAVSRILCHRIRDLMNEHRLSIHDIHYFLQGLFETQPFVALDELLMARPAGRLHRAFAARFSRPTPVEGVDITTLQTWANADPTERYAILGQALSLFAQGDLNQDDGVSPRFLEMLRRASDPAAFLAGAADQLLPSGWNGSLSLVLERRRTMLRTLSTYDDPSVHVWVADQEQRLATLIAEEKTREGESERSFE